MDFYEGQKVVFTSPEGKFDGVIVDTEYDELDDYPIEVELDDGRTITCTESGFQVAYETTHYIEPKKLEQPKKFEDKTPSEVLGDLKEIAEAVETEAPVSEARKKVLEILADSKAEQLNPIADELFNGPTSYGGLEVAFVLHYLEIQVEKLQGEVEILRSQNKILDDRCNERFMELSEVKEENSQYEQLLKEYKKQLDEILKDYGKHDISNDVSVIGIIQTLLSVNDSLRNKKVEQVEEKTVLSALEKHKEFSNIGYEALRQFVGIDVPMEALEVLIEGIQKRLGDIENGK